MILEAVGMNLIAFVHVIFLQNYWYVSSELVDLILLGTTRAYDVFNLVRA